jgi:hypothetical protein
MTKGQGVNLELDDLLHPAQAFNYPSEAVNDPDLTVNEKRAILASWASDACAIEAAPELRAGPKVPVRFEDIMEALRALDHQANAAGFRGPCSPRARSRVSRKRDSEHGRPLP